MKYKKKIDDMANSRRSQSTGSLRSYNMLFFVILDSHCFFVCTTYVIATGRFLKWSVKDTRMYFSSC